MIPSIPSPVNRRREHHRRILEERIALVRVADERRDLRPCFRRNVPLVAHDHHRRDRWCPPVAPARAVLVGDSLASHRLPAARRWRAELFRSRGPPSDASSSPSTRGAGGFPPCRSAAHRGRARRVERPPDRASWPGSVVHDCHVRIPTADLSDRRFPDIGAADQRRASKIRSAAAAVLYALASARRLDRAVLSTPRPCAAEMKSIRRRRARRTRKLRPPVPADRSC